MYKKQVFLFSIIVAIIVGIFLGGFFPKFAIYFSLLGTIFLNSLMMIVVPLVIFSMIVGITGLGDIRNLGSLGKKTVLYYLLTTCIAVLTGLILVNIISPGKGLNPNRTYGKIDYSLSEKDKCTVNLENDTIQKYLHNGRYSLILLDQNVFGTIKTVSTNKITVKFWKKLNFNDFNDEKVIKTDDGSILTVKWKADRLVKAMPELKTTGTGIKIELNLSARLKGKKNSGILKTISEVLVGNKKTGKEGMVPRNIFNAMVRMDLLPLILFSLLFGAALSILGERSKKTVEVIEILNDATMKIVHWIMFFAPIGIFGLITARIGNAGGFKGFLPELYALGYYTLTVILGLTIHAAIFLPLILKYFGKTKIISYLKGMSTALLNAFSTASSSATLPLTIEAVEEENGISTRTASFVLPLGATINMDGTALYEAVAAMFIAQVYNIQLDLIQQTVIFLTATLAAIGAAGIPEAGLVTMVIVLKAVGLPIEGIGMLLSIDWLLDRFRTTVNVWGDGVGAAVVENF